MSEFRTSPTELEKLKTLMNERLKKGELAREVFGEYLVQLVELVNQVYMGLEPLERGLFSNYFEELVGRYFTSYLGIPPPDVKFYEMLPSEYVGKVLEYAYRMLRPKTRGQTEYDIRETIEMKTIYTLTKALELILKLTAPKDIA